MNEKNQELRPHEWIAVATLIFFLAILAKIAWNAPESRWPQKSGIAVEKPQEQIVVTFTGAIQNEGKYQLRKGTTLGEALQTLTVNDDAEISKLQQDRVLKKGQKVRIPRKKQKKR